MPGSVRGGRERHRKKERESEKSDTGCRGTRALHRKERGRGGERERRRDTKEKG